MNNNSNNKESKLRTLLKEGCIAAFYTEKGYFVKIKLALSIDKVGFSFVKKGEKGAGFDIYVDTDKFDLLCDDIRNGNFYKKIVEDTKSDYPEAWKYTTGDNGSKYIAIGKGQKGIVIQGKDNNTKKNAFVMVGSYEDLKCMAKWYARCSKSYYDGLVNICLEAIDKNSRYFKNNDDSGNIPQTSSQNTSEEPKPSPNPQKKEEKEDKKTLKDLLQKTILLRSTTLLTSFGSNGYFCLKSFTQDNKEMVFVINPNDIEKEVWQNFKDIAGASANIKYEGTYVTYNERNYLIDVKLQF